MASNSSLNSDISNCTDCPRLIDYCRQIGIEKRRAYRDWDYWARPVPNLGVAPAGLLIVGLAPAAHGANRTGRMFTGDRSGDWLFRALHRAGFASQPTATDRNDGLELIDALITAVCHCAPPQNRPAKQEVINCQRWLDRSFQLSRPRVVVCLGQIAWQAVFDYYRRQGAWAGARPRFGHGNLERIEGGPKILASYHPSQQNTFTGRLTEEMLDDIFRRCREFLHLEKNNA